uniref:Sushi domain-containing protein n=1 Tax=Chromera velia CCMP2878 TaxID=1169474 RepID=A0A0G4HW69_9ALVE|eukprot:Cvel_32568.t1-p1 / transcript=Cvel_32568.t1 / gene=Cvel_32568 / organism=Chromera_velia_CCMP2878 / gene_product=E-selectin, putative / transcript_product=E-selectin, putative / location=Cvel_scaffold5097:821-5679(+) / protein_length=665 / sequence_SO=supercontig / SO=protein_coding / is_pseudo=false
MCQGNKKIQHPVSLISAAVSCDEVNDPQPNTLSTEVVRSDSGQAGTTTQTATFTYSCNNGYQISGTADPTFTCTGTGYGISAWQGGTVPTCTATGVQLPPPDIGDAFSWTKDGTVTYGGQHTFYMDKSAGECPGRYRVRTNMSWRNKTPASSSWHAGENPPTGAFDSLSDSPWYSSPASTCSSSVDCNLELILEVPCSVSIGRFGVQARETCCPDRSPTEMILSGSSDSGSSWTQIGSISGVTWSSNNETQMFNGDSSQGPFSWFKFDVQRTGTSSADHVMIGNLYLFTPTVSCDEVNDPQPNTLSAEVVRSDSGQAGTTTQTATFTYSCNNGYQISGTADPTFTCTGTAYATSQWQGTVPTCTAVSCDEVNDPQPNALSAEVIRSDSSQAGTTTQTATFTYSCNNGYQISGTANPTFTCTGTAYATSQWQGGTVPTCTAVACDEVNDPQPNALSAEVVRSDSGQAGTTTQTATFTYSCNNGYQISGTANPTFTCTGTAYATSQWQGGTLPTCTAVSCDEVNDPQPNTLSAEVIRSDSNQTGTTTQTATFTYSCNNGYQISGTANPTFTCTGTAYATSQWQGGTVPTCTAVSCDEVNDPQPNTLSAEVIRSNSSQAGTTTQTATFTYSCNNGYQISGTADPTFTCTGTAYATSQWQGTVPTCTGE